MMCERTPQKDILSLDIISCMGRDTINKNAIMLESYINFQVKK